MPEMDNSAIAAVDQPVNVTQLPQPQGKPFEGCSITEVFAAQDLAEEYSEIVFNSFAS
jgi:hypothetical protein